MASTCDYYSMSLSRTAMPRTRASSTSSEVLQCEVKNYFASLNKLTSKILLERENIATSHSHLPQQQKEEVIKEHFIPTTVRELYPRLSKRWPGHKVGDERSLPHTCQSVQDEDSVNSVCSTVITGFQVRRVTQTDCKLLFRYSKIEGVIRASRQIRRRN